MTRDQYLQLRKDNNYISIVYNHYLEKAIIPLPFNLFHQAFDEYLKMMHHNQLRQGNFISIHNIFQKIYQSVIEYYDEKFLIIYMVIEKKVTTIQKVTFII